MRAKVKLANYVWLIWKRFSKSNPAYVNADRLEDNQIYALYAEACERLGLDFERMGRAAQATNGERVFRIWRYDTEFTIAPLGTITEDKAFVCQYLREHGFSVPKGQSFLRTQEREALAFSSTLPGEAVVKPASDTSGGLGVATRLSGTSAFRAAFREACKHCGQVMVEQQIDAEHFRFLVYKGRCLSALHRLKPSVVGDGVSSLWRLVDLENQNRIKTTAWKPGDPVLMPLQKSRRITDFLSANGLDWGHVPKAGERVVLTDIVNYSLGGSYAEVLDDCNPFIIREIERAARLFRLDLAGFDVMSRDLANKEYFINEINVGPSIQLHYFVPKAAQKDPIGTVLQDYFGLASPGRHSKRAEVDASKNADPIPPL